MKPIEKSCIGVVANDAGGANQIFAYLEAHGIIPKFFDLTGPARTHLFNQFTSNQTQPKNFKFWIDDVDLLLTGTSLTFDGEHNARCLARSKSIFSIAVLDHWINYPGRFVRNGIRCTPDEIWVTDPYALSKAQSDFKTIPIKLIESSYKNTIRKLLAPVGEIERHIVAFLTSPAHSDWGNSEPGEFQAIKYFFDNVQKMNLPKSFHVKFSVHPSESTEKYQNFLGSMNLETSFDVTSGQLIETISSAKWIVGLDTYAMTLALGSGRKIYSCLPPWAPNCRLPHADIVCLASL